MTFDADRALVLPAVKLMAAIAKFRKSETWQPGQKLKILLIGYNGKRNTGADVRVKGMVDQFYQILGKENIEIGILALNNENVAVYFQPPTRLIEFSTIFFLPLLRACSSYHMAVLSEGSCLKSKFANSLTLFFVEGSGIMKNQNKPCVAYGSEAGDMDSVVYEIARKLCADTYFIARTENSMKIISDMGLKGEMGTDTAWIFQPGTMEWAEKELREKGWDGKKELVGAAVINPFWWPVKPGITKLLTGYARRHPDEHYEKYYFFSHSEERKQLFDHYLTSIANALNEFVERHDVQPVIIGMEALDLQAITRLQEMLRFPAPIFSSKYYDGYQMTAVLRRLSMLVTSRYHARVLSMPGGVPSIAVSMDERLYNILKETGHLEDYYLKTDDPELQTKLLEAMEKMWGEREKVREDIIRTIPDYLKKMAEMGRTLRNFVKDNFPGVPLPPEPEDWKGYLPPLYPELEQIVEKYG